MKVLHVTTAGRFANLGLVPAEKCTGGGIGTILLSSADYAKRKGLFESKIACDWECAFADQARALGYDVEIIPSFWLKIFNRPMAVIMSVRRIVSIIKKDKIDVVHAYNFSAGLTAGLAAKVCRVPMFVCIHQDITDYVSESKSAFQRWLSRLRRSLLFCSWRWESNHAKKILPVAEYLIKEITNIGIKREKIQVVYNGLDFEKLSKITPDLKKLRDEYGIKDDDFLIGSMGRLSPSKGYRYLIEAAAQLKDDPKLKFIVMGDGELKESLEEQVKQRGLAGRFFFTGQRSDIQEILPSLNLFVLPSLMEGMPTVVLEAMYAKLPVIATAVSGTPEIVKDRETGLLIAPKNPQALVAAISEMKSNATLRDRCIANSYEMIRTKFSIVNKVEEFYKLYSQYVNK